MQRVPDPPARHIVLLRGINLVRRNRIAMPELRAVLEVEGFGAVSTYVQSGNVLLSSTASPDGVAKEVNRIIKQRFGFDIVVVVRSRSELANVVRRNPLAKIAVDPRRYLVTFMSKELPQEIVGRMRAGAAPQEEFVVIGKEVYSWHPAGVGRSPLWERLAAKIPGLAATSRNWSTVTTLLAMADSGSAR